MLSLIIERLNEIFDTEKLTNNDMISYAYTVCNKLYENQAVVNQVANNTSEQAMLGDFPQAFDDAILSSSEAHKEQMMQLLSDPNRNYRFKKEVLIMLKQKVG